MQRYHMPQDLGKGEKGKTTIYHYYKSESLDVKCPIKFVTT